MNSQKLLFGVVILSFLALVAGLVSAEMVFIPSSISLTASHGSSATTSFTISDTYTDQNLTITSYSAYDMSSASGAINSKNITLPTSKPVIQASAISSSLPITFAIPSHQTADTYSGTITVTGNLTNGTIITRILPYGVTVPSAVTMTVTSPADITKASTSSSFTITNTGNVQLTNMHFTYNTDTLKEGTNQATLTFTPSTLSLLPGAVQQVNISSSIPSGFNVKTYTTPINITSNELTSSVNLNLVNDYCTYGIKGSDIEISSIKDISSENDWEWHPLDKVEVEVKVRNNDADNDLDITIALDLYDSSGKLQDVGDEKTISVDSDKSDTTTFKLEIPSDLDEGTYKLYVKAYEDGNQNAQCAQDIQEIDLNRESRDVVLDSINSPSSVSCNANAEITAKVLNIGKHDEDKVKVKIFNKELGVNLFSSSFSLDKDTSKKISFNFLIPQNATEKNYTLDLTTYYNYDSDTGDYDLTSDVYSEGLVVEGGCLSITQSASISASLSSQAVAGKELVVRSTITNTGNTKTTYTLIPTNYDSWAEFERVDPAVLTLDAGQSGTANVYLVPLAEASGLQTFTIQATFSGKTTQQPVEVNLQKAGISITGNAISESIQQNWFIWLVVLINVVLILAIIIVAVKVSSRRKVDEE